MKQDLEDASKRPSALESDQESFATRHLGPDAAESVAMLQSLGVGTIDDLIDQVVPPGIRSSRALQLGPGRSEHAILREMRELARANEIYRSYIGMGYYDCITPPVVQRNILEDPGWYTQYTPYQPEIAQGRLEALLNFQTMVSDLTAMEVANASLLDEGTAAAEAMGMSYAACRQKRKKFFVASCCHPQTIDVVRTRAWPLGIDVVVADHRQVAIDSQYFGALLQYPATDGVVYDLRSFVERAHNEDMLVTVAADLLSLTLLIPPGEFGADIAVGSTQRFGVPMGYGGPHAAFFATRDQFKRQIPGRIVGVSRDRQGRPAFRLALQTREQHIRRDKATSNICTAQVLLAVIAGMYGVYHGPDGLRRIAGRICRQTKVLALGLRKLGYEIHSEPIFDTVRVDLRDQSADAIIAAARSRKMNLRRLDAGSICISLDETTATEDLEDLFEVFALPERSLPFVMDDLLEAVQASGREPYGRTSPFLTHPVFRQYQTETELLRYMRRLRERDLSLTTSMIPLGSCTMKLNAAVEMLPITWPEFARIHPFAPLEQAIGYQELFRGLEQWLSEITGFAGVTLQPNAGSQGEFSGLLVIRKYHESRGEGRRNVCLIPQSAHGTNPASAVMAGMKVVVVACDSRGDIDLADIRAKAEQHAAHLGALMVTYPSTHGVFEESIREICDIIHRHGGQVYMDGANLNAQVGLCRPAEYGADVCHLNLHKTFCIPHGGGGPGVGPIGVMSHLCPFLPTHSVVAVGGEQGIGAVSAAPWGSASILPISWIYIALMGSDGLVQASRTAILNANYVAKRLDPYYRVLYRGKTGLVAHECIVDLRPLKCSAGVDVDDVAKRLMDYGFHAPTVSWPVAGTMMIEPTESESKRELDRFCDAMIGIRKEIEEIESAQADRENNLLKNAPHTADVLLSESWDRPYSRERAAFPSSSTREYKFWPAVSRIDSVYGDRNLVCSCLPVEAFEQKDREP